MQDLLTLGLSLFAIIAVFQLLTWGIKLAFVALKIGALCSLGFLAAHLTLTHTNLQDIAALQASEALRFVTEEVVETKAQISTESVRQLIPIQFDWFEPSNTKIPDKTAA